MKNQETLEEERSKKTAYFNQALAEDPSDVKLWIDYIEFQVHLRLQYSAEVRFCIPDHELFYSSTFYVQLRAEMADSERFSYFDFVCSSGSNPKPTTC